MISEALREMQDQINAMQDRLDAIVNDVPEKPTEDDPDEALTKVIASAFHAYSDFADIARAAREHIAQEADENQQAEAWLRIIRHPVLAAIPASGLEGSYLDAVLDRIDALAQAEAEREAAKDEPERRVNVTITDVYAVPDDYGFLRINVGPETAVIDPDAVNVTVTDVPERPAEDDPDEALAMDMYHAFTGEANESIPLGLRADWLDAARAAREHIAQEADRADFNAAVDYHARAVKAEADRDNALEEAAEAHSRAIFAEQRASKAEALHAALRDDVANPDWSARKSILDRDDERGRS